MKFVYEVRYEYDDDNRNLIGIKIEKLKVLQDVGQHYRIIRRGCVEIMPKTWVHETLETATQEKAENWEHVVQGRASVRVSELLESLESLYGIMTTGGRDFLHTIDAAGALLHKIKRKGK